MILLISDISSLIYSFRCRIAFCTAVLFLNKSSFSNALMKNAMSLPITVFVALFCTASKTFPAAFFSWSRFLHYITIFSCLLWIVLSYSITIFICFSCFSSCVTSSLLRGSSIACRTCSSMVVHNVVRWLEWAYRQSVEQAKAGRVQLSE